jgi:hypothetical protein
MSRHVNTRGITNHRTILRASEQRGASARQHAGSIVGKINKQSFGLDIVANRGVECQAKSVADAKRVDRCAMLCIIGLVNQVCC